MIHFLFKCCSNLSEHMLYDLTLENFIISNFSVSHTSNMTSEGCCCLKELEGTKGPWMWVLLHIAKLHVRCYTKIEQCLLFGSYKYIYKLFFLYFFLHICSETQTTFQMVTYVDFRKETLPFTSWLYTFREVVEDSDAFTISGNLLRMDDCGRWHAIIHINIVPGCLSFAGN